MFIIRKFIAVLTVIAMYIGIVPGVVSATEPGQFTKEDAIYNHSDIADDYAEAINIMRAMNGLDPIELRVMPSEWEEYNVCLHDLNFWREDNGGNGNHYFSNNGSMCGRTYAEWKAFLPSIRGTNASYGTGLGYASEVRLGSSWSLNDTAQRAALWYGSPSHRQSILGDFDFMYISTVLYWPTERTRTTSGGGVFRNDGSHMAMVQFGNDEYVSGALAEYGSGIPHSELYDDFLDAVSHFKSFSEHIGETSTQLADPVTPVEPETQIDEPVSPVYPTCNGVRATIVGTDGDDELTGTDGKDVIVAYGGNDRISGLGGNDIICAGDGRDRIHGGSGSDWISGGANRDVIYGGNNADTIYGNSGNDRIRGNGGNDIIYGNGGNDTLLGGGRDDWIDGGIGENRIDGGDGNNIIV